MKVKREQVKNCTRATGKQKEVWKSETQSGVKSLILHKLFGVAVQLLIILPSCKGADEVDYDSLETISLLDNAEIVVSAVSFPDADKSLLLIGDGSNRLHIYAIASNSPRLALINYTIKIINDSWRFKTAINIIGTNSFCVVAQHSTIVASKVFVIDASGYLKNGINSYLQKVLPLTYYITELYDIPQTNFALILSDDKIFTVSKVSFALSEDYSSMGSYNLKSFKKAVVRDIDTFIVFVENCNSNGANVVLLFNRGTQISTVIPVTTSSQFKVNSMDIHKNDDILIGDLNDISSTSYVTFAIKISSLTRRSKPHANEVTFIKLVSTGLLFYDSDSYFVLSSGGGIHNMKDYIRNSQFFTSLMSSDLVFSESPLSAELTVAAYGMLQARFVVFLNNLNQSPRKGKIYVYWLDQDGSDIDEPPLGCFSSIGLSYCLSGSPPNKYANNGNCISGHGSGKRCIGPLQFDGIQGDTTISQELHPNGSGKDEGVLPCSSGNNFGTQGNDCILGFSLDSPISSCKSISSSSGSNSYGDVCLNSSAGSGIKGISTAFYNPMTFEGVAACSSTQIENTVTREGYDMPSGCQTASADDGVRGITGTYINHIVLLDGTGGNSNGSSNQYYNQSLFTGVYVL